jgi:hypothetical protein
LSVSPESGDGHNRWQKNRAASRRPGTPTPFLAVTSSATPTARRSYLYSRDNPTEALQAKMLTKDEAPDRREHRGLPEVLGKAESD